MTKKLLPKIILILIGFIMGLLLAEIGFQLIGVVVPETILSDVEPAQIYQYDPTLSWELIPGSESRHKTIDYDVGYKINDNGFRDNKDYSLPKKNKRIITIGDSYTFGIGVNNDQTFSKILEKETGCEVLNMGVPGYAPSQYLLGFEMKGLDYKPDMVILSIHMGTDILPGILKYRSIGTARYKPYFEIESGQLVLRGVPVPKEEDMRPQKSPRIKNENFYNFTKWFLKWKTFTIAKNFLKRDGLYPILEKIRVATRTEDYDLRLDTIELIIDRMKTNISKLGNDGKLMIVIIPMSTVNHDHLEKLLIDELVKRLEKSKTSYINLMPRILDLKNIYFKHDSHFNPEGNALVADELKNALNKFITCPKI